MNFYVKMMMECCALGMMALKWGGCVAGVLHVNRIPIFINKYSLCIDFIQIHVVKVSFIFYILECYICIVLPNKTLWR